VSDEIQTAANLRLRYFLMDGPTGASTVHARQQPDRAFRRAEEALKALRESPSVARNDGALLAHRAESHRRHDSVAGEPGDRRV